MAEGLPQSDIKRPPQSQLVHSYGRDVEGVYPFPAELARRAVRVTRAGDAHYIRHEVFRAGLAPEIEGVVKNVSAQFNGIHEELPCNRCEAGCGLLERNSPGLAPRTNQINLFIRVGVDRAKETEEDRPDQPILAAHVRCYNALEPQTDDNYDTYARAQVEKLPEGLQFDERCHVVMGEVALAAFKHFEARLVRLETARR